MRSLACFYSATLAWNSTAVDMRRKSTGDLDEVVVAAAATSLTGFAAGLRRDIGAVQASLDLPWTTSPAEGQINRLKMLKRTMYGRAGFALLRARVLNAA